MAGSVVRTGSKPEPDPVELDLMFRFWGVPPDLTSVRFGVLVFHSKNRTELDNGNTKDNRPSASNSAGDGGSSSSGDAAQNLHSYIGLWNLFNSKICWGKFFISYLLLTDELKTELQII